jgi:replicative DNA helicase
MIQLQFINYLLSTKDVSILERNAITKDYFTEYSDEFDFIVNHYQTYKVIPDIETFVSKFQDFSVLQVSESERYLVDSLREEYLYSKSVPVIKRAAELLKTDANAASQYLQSELINLTPNYTTTYVDIIHSDNRVNVFEDKSLNPDTWYIPTGFEELDYIVNGWQQGEEFVVIFARTGQGKSWFLIKSMQHAWLMGKNVGYISPEMTADKIGYRFDTLNHNYSNRALLRGDTSEIAVADYRNYIKELNNHDNKFLVATPLDFNKQVTVAKLRDFVNKNKLDILAVDGITYLTDERYKRGDTKTTTLTNISEDLMQLSVELKIPVLVVVQSNRGGVKEDENATPALEDIRDSDGISHNATKVIALKQKEEGLVIEIKKHRDGAVGGKLTYLWDIDKGEFSWMGGSDDTAPPAEKEKRKSEIKEPFKQGKVVF